jgi:DNA-binding LacI/PurR family transcriptional regulator
VHVVSCNNERPYLDQLHPQPAVIDIRADFIGRRAVRQLMHRLECSAEPHERILVEPSLIVPEGA